MYIEGCLPKFRIELLPPSSLLQDELEIEAAVFLQNVDQYQLE
jgi:hypothetical protein